MIRLLEYLDRLSKSGIIIICLSLIAFFAVIDYVTGPDIAVFVFYLIPIFLAFWRVGAGAGIAASTLSALAWSVTDELSAPVHGAVIIPYWNMAIRLGFFLIVIYMLAALKASLERERHIARIDYLTGAVNNRYFRELAEAEINRARRYYHPFTAVYLDIDNFKGINDSLGHSAGDALLQLMVKTIQSHTRISDVLARVGGDEFMLLLPETGFETAQQVVGKVKLRLADAMQENKWPVSFSFGMVTFQEPPDSVDHMINLADKLMYEGKNSGKNTICHELYEKSSEAVTDSSFGRLGHRSTTEGRERQR